MALDNVPENQREAVAASVKKLVCAKIGYSNENACPMKVTMEVPDVGRRLRSNAAAEQATAARRLQQLSSILMKVRCCRAVRPSYVRAVPTSDTLHHHGLHHHG